MHNENNHEHPQIFFNIFLHIFYIQFKKLHNNVLYAPAYHYILFLFIGIFNTQLPFLSIKTLNEFAYLFEVLLLRNLSNSL